MFKMPMDMSNQSFKGYIILDLWKMFQFAELTEVMRQTGENLLIQIYSKFVWVMLMSF